MANVAISLASAVKAVAFRTVNLRYVVVSAAASGDSIDVTLPDNSSLISLEALTSVGARIVNASYNWAETAQVLLTVFPYTRTSPKATLTLATGGFPALSQVLVNVVM